MLRWITDSESFEVPRSAVVIGGGNVAMDAARSLARLQRQTFGEVRVTVCALEDFDHFLADDDEVRESDEEGIRILDSRGPQACIVQDGRLVGLSTLKVVSIFDEQQRFAPRYDESDRLVHEGEMIIEAIGQMTDTDLLGEELTEALEWKRGRLQVDADGRTSAALAVGRRRHGARTRRGACGCRWASRRAQHRRLSVERHQTGEHIVTEHAEGHVSGRERLHKSTTVGEMLRDRHQLRADRARLLSGSRTEGQQAHSLAGRGTGGRGTASLRPVHRT